MRTLVEILIDIWVAYEGFIALAATVALPVAAFREQGAGSAAAMLGLSLLPLAVRVAKVFFVLSILWLLFELPSWFHPLARALTIA